MKSVDLTISPPRRGLHLTIIIVVISLLVHKSQCILLSLIVHQASSPLAVLLSALYSSPAHC